VDPIRAVKPQHLFSSSAALPPFRLSDQTVPSGVNRSSFFDKSRRKDTRKLEKKCKAFNDISKYFSKKEWAKLNYSEKTTYAYMKRNYDTMTSLGLQTTVPDFMSSSEQTQIPQEKNSDEDQNLGSQDETSQEASGVTQPEMTLENPTMEENDLKAVPETSGSENTEEELSAPEKESTSELQNAKPSGPEEKEKSIWAHRLRERKNPVVYEEISDPEEED
ncbi:protein SSX1, partial [Tupaia chinensis]|uniref:protein SSX1 n=1 Tax=Tupaia chinensis TaxID=246437 RepID=UPI0003C9163B